MKPPYTVEHLSSLYPNTTPVLIGDLTLTLGQALDMQAFGCPVPAAERDGVRDVAYLAGKLSAAGSLRSEDYNLLDIIPKTES
jgi:hypothetical protein